MPRVSASACEISTHTVGDLLQMPTPSLEIATGACGCWDPWCTRAGKHPGGHVEPTNDPRAIAEWGSSDEEGWRTNTLFAMGEMPCGCFAIGFDLDGPEAQRVFAEVTRPMGVPAQPTTITGRDGGTHVVLVSDRPLAVGEKTMNALIPDESTDGINVRAKGGFLVAPGSLHARTGRTYRLASASLARMPEALRDLVEKPEVRTREPGIPDSPFSRRVLGAKAEAALLQTDLSDRSANLAYVAIEACVRGLTFEEFSEAVLASSGAARAHVEDQPDPERALERAWRAAVEEVSGRASTTERVTEYAIRRAEREGLAPGPRRMLHAVCRAMRKRKHYRDFPLDERTAAEEAGVHHDTAAEHLRFLVNEDYLRATREGLRPYEATLYSLPGRRVTFETPITEIPPVGLDAWRHGELGDTGRRVHRRLTDEPMTLKEITEASDVSRATVYRVLPAMERHGLARPTGRGWVRGDADPADYIATGPDRPGALAEQQRERHEREREAHKRARAKKRERHESRRQRAHESSHTCMDGRHRTSFDGKPTCCPTAIRAKTLRSALSARLRPCGAGRETGTPHGGPSPENAAQGHPPSTPDGVPSRAPPG